MSWDNKERDINRYSAYSHDESRRQHEKDMIRNSYAHGKFFFHFEKFKIG